MALPYLQSYGDPRVQKAYERSLGGEPLRSVAKALRIPLRTLARRCKDDGWIDERKARILATESEHLATTATAIDTAVAKSGEVIEPKEERTAGMDRVLRIQQQITGLLRTAYQRDLEKTLADAQASGKLPTRSQVAQLVTLGNNVLAMERKAWCVPEKMELKDTTPAAEKHVDNVRRLKEQIERDRAITPSVAAEVGGVGEHGPM